MPAERPKSPIPPWSADRPGPAAQPRLRRPNRFEVGVLTVGAIVLAALATGMGGQRSDTATAPPTTVTAAPVTVTATRAAPQPTTVTVTATVTKALSAKPRTVTVTRPPAVGNLAPEPASPEREVYYANCSAARRARVTPLYAGEAGYRTGLDRDGDGVACE